MRKLLNNKQEKYLINIIPNRTTKEIQELMLKKYNINIKRGYLENFKLKNNINSGLRIKYTDEQKEFLKKIVEDYYTKEVINLFYKKFKIKLKEKQIKDFRAKYKLYRKDNTGRFKKNCIPHNIKPIGYEFKSTDGYTYKKAKDGKYKRKQLVIYENKYGKIPKGYSVIYLDKNKNNFKLNNLQLVKNKDKLTAKNRGLITTNKELTKIGILVAKLTNKNCELRKQK